jgi:hypothetical protein
MSNTVPTEIRYLLRILNQYPIHTAPELFSIIQFKDENNTFPNVFKTLENLENTLWKLEGFQVDIYDTSVCSVTGRILNRWCVKHGRMTVFLPLRGLMYS